MEGDEECGFLQFFRKNGELGSPYPLSYGKTTIGSCKDSDIRLKINDSRLEQVHCVINVYSEGLATLVNKSQNYPTKVNDEIVTQFRVLNHMDKFEIVGKFFQYFNVHINKKDVAKLEKTLTQAISPSKTRQSMFPITATELEVMEVVSQGEAPDSKFIVSIITPERKPDTKNVSTTKAKTTSKVVVSKTLHVSPDKTQRRLSVGNAIKKSGTTPKISSRNVLLSPVAKTPLNTRVSLKNDKSSIKRSLLKRYSSTPKITTPVSVKKTNDFKFSPIVSTSSNYQTPNTTMSPIESEKSCRRVLDSSNKTNESKNYSSKFISRRSASLRNEIIKTAEDESILESLKSSGTNTLEDSNISLGLDLDAIPNISKVDLDKKSKLENSLKSKTPVRTSLRKKALQQNMVNSDLELFTDRELNMVQKKLENDESIHDSMMTENNDSIVSISTGISTPENNMSVVIINTPEVNSPMTRRSKKLMATSIIDTSVIEIDDTPKSVIKGRKSVPKTPEQKSSVNDKGFKTPLTTPHVFDKIRKSAIKSRLKSLNVNELVEEDKNHGQKRGRESTGSVGRSTKKIKLLFKSDSYSDDDSLSELQQLESSISEPSKSEELSQIMNNETPNNNPDEFSTSRKSNRLSNKLRNSEDNFLLTLTPTSDKNISTMSFGVEGAKEEIAFDITLPVSGRKTSLLHSKKSCRRSELDMLLKADQTTISNISSASRKSGRQSLVLSEDDFSDTSSNASKVSGRISNLEDLVESDTENLSPIKKIDIIKRNSSRSGKSFVQDETVEANTSTKRGSTRKSTRKSEIQDLKDLNETSQQEIDVVNVTDVEGNTSVRKSTRKSMSVSDISGVENLNTSALEESTSKLSTSRKSLRKSDIKDTENIISQDLEVENINTSQLSTSRKSLRKSEIKDISETSQKDLDVDVSEVEGNKSTRKSLRKSMSVSEQTSNISDVENLNTSPLEESNSKLSTSRKSLRKSEIKNTENIIYQDLELSTISDVEENKPVRKSTRKSISEVENINTSLEDSTSQLSTSRKSLRKSVIKDISETSQEDLDADVSEVEGNKSTRKSLRKSMSVSEQTSNISDVENLNTSPLEESTSKLSTSRRSLRKSEIKDFSTEENSVLDESTSKMPPARKSTRKSEIKDTENIIYQDLELSTISDAEGNKSVRKSTRKSISEVENINNSALEESTSQLSTSRKSLRKSEISQKDFEVDVSEVEGNKSTRKSLRKSMPVSEQTSNISGVENLNNSALEESTSQLSTSRRSIRKSEIKDLPTKEIINNSALNESTSKVASSRKSTRKSELKDTAESSQVFALDVSEQISNISGVENLNNSALNDSTSQLLTSRKSLRKSEIKDMPIEEMNSKIIDLEENHDVDKDVSAISAQEENKSSRKSTRSRKSLSVSEQQIDISGLEKLDTSALNESTKLSTTRRSIRKSEIKDTPMEENVNSPIVNVSNRKSELVMDLEESDDSEEHSSAPTPNNSMLMTKTEHSFSVLSDISNAQNEIAEKITRKSLRKSIASTDLDTSDIKKRQSRAKSTSFIDSQSRNNSIVLELSQSELHNLSALLDKEVNTSVNRFTRKSVRSSVTNKSLVNEENNVPAEASQEKGENLSIRKSVRLSVANEGTEMNTSSRKSLRKSTINEIEQQEADISRKSSRLSKVNNSLVDDMFSSSGSSSFVLQLENVTMDNDQVEELAKEQTPKVPKSPLNDLTEIHGVKKLMQTPKISRSPKNDLTNVAGVKNLLKTPRAPKSPLNDLTEIRGVKKLMATPKSMTSPKNDLTDIHGVKSLLRTPRVVKSPKNDLSDVQGVKKLLNTPKVQNSTKNDLTEVKGVKSLLNTPKPQNSPKNTLLNVTGVKQLLGSTKKVTSPKNDLSDVEGLKKLMKTPRVTRIPKNDLTDVEGVQQLFDIHQEVQALNVSGVHVLSDCETNDDVFDRLSEKKKRKTYSRGPKSPEKPLDFGVAEEAVPQVDPSVESWVKDQQKNTELPQIQLNGELLDNPVESPFKKKSRSRKLMSDDDIKEPQEDITYSVHKSEKPVLPTKTRKTKAETLDSILTSALGKPSRLSKSKKDETPKVESPAKAKTPKQVEVEEDKVSNEEEKAAKPVRNRRKIGEDGLEPVEPKRVETIEQKEEPKQDKEEEIAEPSPVEEPETVKETEAIMKTPLEAVSRSTRRKKETPVETSTLEKPTRSRRGIKASAVADEEVKPSPRTTTRGAKAAESEQQETPQSKRTLRNAKVAEEVEKPSATKLKRGGKAKAVAEEKSSEEEATTETSSEEKLQPSVEEPETEAIMKTPLDAVSRSTRRKKETPVETSTLEKPTRSRRGIKASAVVDEEVKPSPRTTTRGAKAGESEQQETPQSKRTVRNAKVTEEDVEKPSEEKEVVATKPKRGGKAKAVAEEKSSQEEATTETSSEEKPSEQENSAAKPTRRGRNAKAVAEEKSSNEIEKSSEEEESAAKPTRKGRNAKATPNEEDTSSKPRRGGRNAKPAEEPEETKEDSDEKPSENQASLAKPRRGRGRVASIQNDSIKESPRKTTRNARKVVAEADTTVDDEAPKTTRGKRKAAEEPEQKNNRGKKAAKEVEEEQLPEPSPVKKVTRGKKVAKEVEEEKPEPSPVKRTTRGRKMAEKEEEVKPEPSPIKKPTRGGRKEVKEEPKVEEVTPEPSPKKPTRGGRKVKEEPKEVTEELEPSPKKSTRGKKAEQASKKTTRGKKTSANESEEVEEVKPLKRGRKFVEEDKEDAAPTPKRNKRGLKVHFDEVPASEKKPSKETSRSKRTKK